MMEATDTPINFKCGFKMVQIIVRDILVVVIKLNTYFPGDQQWHFWLFIYPTYFYAKTSTQNLKAALCII